jgi:hypothetical protein
MDLGMNGGIASRAPTISAQLRALSFAVARCRFNLVVLIAGAVLLVTDQGRDLLIAYGEDDKTLRLTAGVFVWAFSIWGWARVLLDIQWAELPGCVPCYNFWRRWLPRILGVIAFAVVVFSAWQAQQLAIAYWALGGMVLFFVFVWKRRPWARRLAAAAAHNRPSIAAIARLFEAADIEPMSLPPHPDLWSALQLPSKDTADGDAIALRWHIFLTMVVGWVLLFALATFTPVVLGSHMGAMLLLFVWSATWLPVGSLLSYYADRLGFPLLTGLVLLAVISSFFNDNHEIRHTIEASNVKDRPTVSAALAAWGKANAAADGKPVPFVIVATAGGGIRAAYWTGTVLGKLHEEVKPELPRRLFAVSSVSGGSVGAAAYRALVAFHADSPEKFAQACPADKGGMLSCAQRALSEDFLGAVSAALLYPDLVQRFVPYPIFPDRGAALEEAFETAFDKTTGDEKIERSLMALSKQQPWPALFLNATWVGNGRRIVASNLRYDDQRCDDRRADDKDCPSIFFRLVNDQLTIIGRDLRLSTAAHNSARFPFVSPPGMWKDEHGAIEGRLQDGGLFENYGAETAQEILTLACAIFHCVSAPGTRGAPASSGAGGGAGEGVTVFPVVILISSDPSLPQHFADSPVNPPIEFGYEVRATVRSYERVRSGRGQEAASQLEEWTTGHGGRFFHFRMCDPKTKGVQPPLGWALSSAARQRIASYLVDMKDAGETEPSCAPDNRKELKSLTELLARRS